MEKISELFSGWVFFQFWAGNCLRLLFFPLLYMTQKVCDKAVSTHPSIIEYVPEQFKTQEICDKAADRCFFVFDSVSN